MGSAGIYFGRGLQACAGLAGGAPSSGPRLAAGLKKPPASLRENHSLRQTEKTGKKNKIKTEKTKNKIKRKKRNENRNKKKNGETKPMKNPQAARPPRGPTSEALGRGGRLQGQDLSETGGEQEGERSTSGWDGF